MCGISFTYCNSKINTKTKITIESVYKKFQKLLRKKKPKTQFILDNAIKYKTDCNFVEFFRSKQERKNVKKLVKLLKKKSHKDSNSSEAVWFFEEELNNRYKFVKSFLNKKKYYADSAIIFYKTLNSIINSINIQEIRGRDSMGLLLNFYLKKNNLNKSLIQKFENENVQKSETSKFFVITLVFKTFNIYGSLKDNSKKILNEIKSNKILEKIIFNLSFEKVVFMAHTRWASSGEVNFLNTHPADNSLEKKKKSPLIYTIMNGDINNYQAIFETLENKKKILNKKKINDTKLFSCLLGSDNDFFNKAKIKQKINSLKGSFASINICSLDMTKILITKKGKQGIYLGKNSDRIFLSSDIYGLVEDCNLNSSIQSDSFFYFDLNKIKINKLESLEHRKNKNNFVFKKTNITSRDVSKNNFDHYMKKEIYEAKDVINKTIKNYAEKNFQKNFFKNCNFIKKIKSKKINKIYITGMGTCYTAGLSISNYMQKHFKKNDISLEVSPIIAAEGSVFKIENDMSNVLLIVIAQSGTTKDTNVFADIAKRRGASTISFLNKRGGDISYLVDNTFYIGDGRDIEMAVPSTKTYFAHIILGQIFTLYLINEIKNFSKFNNSEFLKIKKTSKLISETVKKFKKVNLKNYLNQFSKNKQWYVLFDNQETQFISEETRIKMSECCYKTVSNVHIDDFLNLNIKNSCILLNLSSEKKNYPKLQTLIQRNNVIIIIGPKKNNFERLNSKKVISIKTENTENNFLSFTYVIITQLISYELAKFLDAKKNLFFKIKNEILQNDKVNKNIQYFLKQDKEEYFFISVSNLEVEKLYKFLSDYLNNKILNYKKCIDQIDMLINQISRPIDTIKHQAKTITVGTERVNTLKKLNNYKNQNFKFKKKLSRKQLFIFTKNINELMKNYLMETINHYSRLSKKIIKINFIDLENFNQFKQKNIKYLKVENDIKNFGYLIINSFNNNTEMFIDLERKIKFPNKYFLNFFKTDLSLFLILDDLFKLNITKIYKSELFNDLNSLEKFKDKFKLEEINKFNKNIKNFKILASSQNKSSSKILSLLIGKYLGTTCSFDILENHKHIDISSEPYLIAIVTDLESNDYKQDALSEFQKFRSHNNKLLIITNNNDNTYDKELDSSEIIKLPSIKNRLSLLMVLKLFEKYLK